MPDLVAHHRGELGLVGEVREPPDGDENTGGGGVMRRTHEGHEAKEMTVGAVYMVLLSLLLFFFPAINGLAGGLAGGYRVGEVRRALLAAIAPAVVLALALWLI